MKKNVTSNQVFGEPVYYVETNFFMSNQSVYEQLTLRWQIAKQLSELHPLSLSNNKNYRLRKRGNFPLQ